VSTASSRRRLAATSSTTRICVGCAVDESVNVRPPPVWRPPWRGRVRGG
jgi:hypothetical protein